MNNATGPDGRLKRSTLLYFGLPDYAVYLAAIPVSLYLPFVYSRDLGLELTDIGLILTERGWHSAFIKPAVGATSRETLRFGDDGPGLDAGQRHLDRLLPVEDLLVQPYLSSVETEGELSVVFFDGQISHSVRKQPLPGDYRAQDDYGASDRPVELNPAEATLARRVVSAVGQVLLYARTDFLRDDAGQLRLTELELTEPSLFFRHGPGAAKRLADSLCRRVEASQHG